MSLGMAGAQEGPPIQASPKQGAHHIQPRTLPTSNAFFTKALALPGGLRQLPMYLLIHIHIEGPLHEGEGHLQGFHPQWGAVVSNELQPLNAHQPTVAGCILLQILAQV